MSSFLTSSIGKKFLMSISGIFLITFLLVHLTANLFLLAGSDAYNIATHFMDTNPIIQIMQPVLALGFLVHIVYGIVLSIQNMKARPTKYKKVNQKESSTWASRNMLPLGIFIFAFLVLHIINYFVKMKFTGSPLFAEVEVQGETMHDAYALVSALFSTDAIGGLAYLYSGAYIIGFIALGIHLHHGFWSAFQTLGWSNIRWRKILTRLGDIYVIVITIGFTIIPFYFLFF